ncbi:MAG: phosphoribosylanthranilate isomerase [Isosphaeraceae bacterium]
MIGSPGPPGRCLVKVCGLTNAADARMVASAGAFWVGLNFHGPSPRSIPLDAAGAIINALPPTCEPVGLFVNRPPDEVRRACRQVGLKIVQLHGDEPPTDLVELDEFRVIRAFRLGCKEDVARMVDHLAEAERLKRPPYAVLIDAYVPGQAGGTGRMVEESILESLPPIDRLILAGGLNPENVAERILRVAPWMVDVASGTESRPGRKDSARVTAFVRAVANAAV